MKYRVEFTTTIEIEADNMIEAEEKASKELYSMLDSDNQFLDVYVEELD